MAKGKLILICQSGGEFVTNDNGNLSYDGGEANAVNVNQETVFDDLKLKVAEMCNLDYKTVSLKYFLPGNRRNLITLKFDKDLKRMIDFHGNSVTADVFVTGKAGFDPDALNAHAAREGGIKLAETVNHVEAKPPANSSPANTTNPVGTNAASHVTKTPRKRGRKRKAAARADARLVTLANSVLAAEAAPENASEDTSVSIPSDHSADGDSDYAPRSVVAIDAAGDSPSVINVNATPADTVKKRRRSGSHKVGSATSDDTGRKRSRKKLVHSHNIIDEADERRLIEFESPSTVDICDNDSLEKVVASWKDGITGIGQEFKSVKEFRDTLHKYAIAHRFSYRLKKNDTNRASGRCVMEGCSWRIHASWVPTAQSFTIKKFNNLHTCDEESRRSAHPTKNWLVDIIKDRLRESPHHKPKDIASSIFQDFGIELNYTQVWRGLEDAREQLQGSHKEAYNLLPQYCQKLLETNPGSFAELVTDEDKKFRSIFICFQASKHGFQNGCRPLLFLEATSLRSKYQEILLTATAVDGDDHFFPVAFAVFHTENDDNWRWFLEQLKSAILSPIPITFVLDREKGLQNMVHEVFENAHHGYSIYHLLSSFKKNLKGPFHADGKGSLHSSFLAAAHAVRVASFKKFTEQIKLVSQQAYDFVMQIEPEYWTSLFKGESFNHILENVGEMYISLMEDVRESPIIHKIEALRRMMGEMIKDRRMESSMWSSKLTPSKEEKLQDETVNSHGLKVLISSDTLFEVHDESIHVLNINNSDCSCLKWKETGLPCCHAIAVFRRIGRNVYDYCSRYFSVECFKSTYLESINPVLESGKPLEKKGNGSDTDSVLPPCAPRPLCQEKKEKIDDPNRRTVTCSKCKGSGHNKASCKATI